MAEEPRPAEDNPLAVPPEPAPVATAEKEPEEDWPTRFKYLLADFENFRRRSDREREGARSSARAEVLRALLPIYETFERGVAAARHLKREDPLRHGLELLAQEWDAFWNSEGVVPVARTGDRFRSDAHEAVGEGSAEPGHPDGTILEVVQQGYRTPAGLLRPAKVVVARTPPPISPATAAAESEPVAEKSEQ